jgi:hypothetical protein
MGSINGRIAVQANLAKKCETLFEKQLKQIGLRGWLKW